MEHNKSIDAILISGSSSFAQDAVDEVVEVFAFETLHARKFLSFDQNLFQIDGVCRCPPALSAEKIPGVFDFPYFDFVGGEVRRDHGDFCLGCPTCP